MKRKMSAIFNQSESSLRSDHERRNTKKRCDREDAEDQIEQHEVSDQKEVSVCDIGFNALNAESTKQRGKAAICVPSSATRHNIHMYPCSSMVYYYLFDVFLSL